MCAPVIPHTLSTECSLRSDNDSFVAVYFVGLSFVRLFAHVFGLAVRTQDLMSTTSGPKPSFIAEIDAK